MISYFIYTFTFLIGGSLYCLLELLWRGRTHYSMFFCGGFVILILFAIYQNNKSISFIKFCVIGSLLITTLEFIFGIIFNIALKMNVWDYSNVPMNILGQICVPFTLIWFALSGVLFIIFKLVDKFIVNI